MTETLIALLLRLSEADGPARFWGHLARRHFGDTFERLLRTGILIEDAPADFWPPCPNCDCERDERPIERIDGAFVAICPMESGADLVLDRDDIRAFQVDQRRLVAALGENSLALAEPLPGLWQLGRKVGGRELFVTLRRSVAGNPALASVILVHAGPHAVLISPALPGRAAPRLKEAGIPVVLASETIGLDAAGLPCLDENAIQSQVRTDRIRLEIRVREGVVLIDGTPQRVPQRPFQFLVLLATNACERRGPVSKYAFFKATKREASDVVRELKAALTKGRPNATEVSDWIVTRRGQAGYELTLDRNQILLVP